MNGQLLRTHYTPGIELGKINMMLEAKQVLFKASKLFLII